MAELKVRTLTAAKIILLAAHDLTTTEHKREFTEWDLTLAVWDRDRKRFGMKGYELTHPDHKRVSSEIMGSKPKSPVTLGYLAKIRPNTYTLTMLGKAEAERLIAGPEPSNNGKAPTIYERLAPYRDHPTFKAWQRDPIYPKSWALVEDFLACSPHRPESTEGQIEYADESFRMGVNWLRGERTIGRGPARGEELITLSVLGELQDFMRAMRHRFEKYMTAPKVCS